MNKKKYTRNIKLTLPVLIFFAIILVGKYLGIVNIDFKNNIDNKDEISIHFIDVGQADSILIKSTNESLLIDGGNNNDGDLVVEYLKNQNVTNLKYIVATHSHEDHIGGLDNVINNFQVQNILIPKSNNTTKTYYDVIKAVQNKGLKLTEPISGEEFKLGEITFKILAPNSKSYENRNNESIVLKATYGEKSFIFTGDAEAVSEKEILSKGYNITADVLKIAHHGSNSSTIDSFLEAVNPKYAVISVGKDNDYGHPMQDIMNKLKKRNVPVYRTDESGTIIINCDGSTIKINANKGTYKSGIGTKKEES